MKTLEIEALLKALEREGYLTGANLELAERIAQMGRDPGYMPEGTEDWMQEDGVPRAYDRPRKGAPAPHSYEDMVLTPNRMEPPPPRPSEPAELAKHGIPTRDMPTLDEVIEARIRTLEATVTDLMRRLKALEERSLDPSA